MLFAEPEELAVRGLKCQIREPAGEGGSMTACNRDALDVPPWCTLWYDDCINVMHPAKCGTAKCVFPYMQTIVVHDCPKHPHAAQDLNTLLHGAP